MSMRRISKLFLALAIVAGPLTLASCDNDPWGDDNYYYNDLVSDAVRNYLREYQVAQVIIQLTTGSIIIIQKQHLRVLCFHGCCR